VAGKSEKATKSLTGGDPLSSSPRSRRRQLAGENMDVTTYLLHRMLGAPAQLSDGGTQLVDAGKKSSKDADDRHSEAGTYTIDEEDDEVVKKGVREARERIDDVFGICGGPEHTAGDVSGRFVRPIIEAEQTRAESGGLDVDADEEVFVSVDADDEQQQHYVSFLTLTSSFFII